MTETTTDIRLKGRQLKTRLDRLRWNVSTYLHAIDWRLNPDARRARQTLLPIRDELKIDADNPPKVLRLKTGEGEHISIRRLEGDTIYSYDDTAGLEEPTTDFFVNADLLPEGAIGVLVVPSGAKCLNKELLEKYPPEELGNWNMEVALADNVPYQEKDWKIDAAAITLVCKQNGRFFILGSRENVGERLPDIYDKQDTVFTTSPDSGDLLHLGTIGSYLSVAESNVKRHWYKTRARFYVLVKGSGSSKKTKRVSSLVERPAEAEQII